VLARSGDPEALADALAPLLDSAELRRAIGENARERFMQEYTDVAMCERVDRELRGLVVRRGAPADASRVVG
jgi:glycosyltransferase involved in cell wall biosynthesis